MPSPSPRLRFPPSRRLHGLRAFAAVFREGLRRGQGPIVLVGRPNALPHLRLGLSVSRRVGTAVLRNRIKRLLREAFRLSQHDFPPGYDVVVIVRPHPPQALADYQRLLAAGLRGLHQEWQRRTPAPPKPEPPGQ